MNRRLQLDQDGCTHGLAQLVFLGILLLLGGCHSLEHPDSRTSAEPGVPSSRNQKRDLPDRPTEASNPNMSPTPGLNPSSWNGPQVPQENTPAPEKPNVILIVADDLGYGDLGSYGQKRILTPRLDQMAREGMRFTSFYAGSTVCAPSRCVLMTGLHTGHSYIRGNQRIPLPDESLTIAEVLQSAGYQTGGIGKWGLGNEGTSGSPIVQGFQDFFGYLDQGHAHNYYPSFLILNDQKIPLKNVVPDEKPSGAGVASDKIQYSHDLFIQGALSFIDLYKDKPFFLYLPLTIPHANNEAGMDGMEVPELGPYADQDWPAPQKALAAMISRLDSDVGRILDRLNEWNLDSKTLILFTSDNGPHKEGGNDPGFFNSSGGFRGIKRDLYEGGIRVPFLARWEGTIPENVVSNQVAGFQDIFPTLSELAAAQDHTPHTIDGISLVPTLTQNPQLQKQHSHLYWEFHEQGGKTAVRKDEWKAIFFHSTKKIELYNLDQDPTESREISSANLMLTMELRKLMESSRSPSEYWGEIPKPSPQNNLSLSPDIVRNSSPLPHRQFQLVQW